MTVSTRAQLIVATLAVWTLCGIPNLRADQDAQTTAPPVFRSSVSLVRVNAVVRDRKGRFIKNLTVRDFEILDGGQPQRITDFQIDRPGLSVALLVDVSGSMEARLDQAREAATHLLSGLDPVADEAAVYTFDTHLDEVAPFTAGLMTLPDRLSVVKPFGATSLHDAIARTAERLVSREGRRRAVVVFTDGQDTASRLTPTEVSSIASAIDVPVYIVGLVPAIDNPSADVSTVDPGRSALSGALTNLSSWTGGHTFVASSAADRSVVARQILEELRHQYLMAFTGSARPGWHALVVRTRDKELIVRARSGYNAGQSRPVS